MIAQSGFLLRCSAGCPRSIENGRSLLRASLEATVPGLLPPDGVIPFLRHPHAPAGSALTSTSLKKQGPIMIRRSAAGPGGGPCGAGTRPDGYCRSWVVCGLRHGESPGIRHVRARLLARPPWTLAPMREAKKQQELCGDARRWLFQGACPACTSCGPFWPMRIATYVALPDSDSGRPGGGQNSFDSWAGHVVQPPRLRTVFRRPLPEKTGGGSGEGHHPRHPLILYISAVPGAGALSNTGSDFHLVGLDRGVWPMGLARLPEPSRAGQCGSGLLFGTPEAIRARVVRHGAQG